MDSEFFILNIIYANMNIIIMDLEVDPCNARSLDFYETRVELLISFWTDFETIYDVFMESEVEV